MTRLIFLACCMLTSLAASFAAEPAAAPFPKDRIVLLISVDGLAHYYLDDPKAEMPNIRKLATEGARAVKMKAVMPTVTWPNHTSIVTGVTPAKHGVVGNTYLDRARNEFIPLIWDPLLNKEDIVKVPTIYDVAKQAGLSTAAVCWPGSRGAKTLDWTVPIVNKSQLFVDYTTLELRTDFAAAGIPFENEADGFIEGHGQDRDRLHVRMLKLILEKHRPQLALMHILEVDHVEHMSGPQSAEAYAAVKFADGLVGEIREELERLYPGKATIFLVSDHGFFPYRQIIQPNVALRQAGLLTAVGGKITGGDVRVVTQGGGALVYVKDRTKLPTMVPQLRTMFENMEGVKLVLGPEELAKYGFADASVQPQMGDMVLSAKSGYMFNDVAGGEEVVTPPLPTTKGMHGYDPNEPMMHATFVAWGAGIKPGSNAGEMANLSVAPTMARVLGLKMEGVEGVVLEGILER